MTSPRARLSTFAAALALAVACDEAPPAEDPAPATPRPKARENPCKSSAPPSFCDAGTTAASGAGCAYQIANGVCDLGPDGDSCACVDCEGAAQCAGRCVDDGACKLADGGEDCTCLDCHRVVAACSPASLGCKNDGLCSPASDDCTCADCAALPACNACVTNGECVPYLEGCACADCMNTPACSAAGFGGASGASGSQQ